MTSTSATVAERTAAIVAGGLTLLILTGCSDGGTRPGPGVEQTEPITLSSEGGCDVDLAESRPATTIHGGDAGDFLADRFSLAVGDFNDDTLDDLLVGAPLADGLGNERENAGEAYVIFGQSAPPDTIDLATYSTFRIIGQKSGDNLGFSVAAGDVNGDGSDDILVGARFAGPESRPNAGVVYVVFGGEQTFSGPSPPAALDLASAAADSTVTGPSTGALLSIALATGDVDGDGADDIIAGASGTDGPDARREGAGSAVVILGSTSPASAIDLESQSPALTLHGARAGDALPNHLATGDLDGDGRDELIVGAPFADTPDGEDAGRTYVIPFREGSIDFADGDAVTISGGERKDGLGFEVAAGDLNGDGVDDLIIGARDADGPEDSINNGGEIHVMFGGSELPRSIDLRDGSSDMLIYSADAGDSLGFSVASADVNLDGLDDVLAGVPLADSCENGRLGAGDVYVIFGRAEPVPEAILLAGSGDLAYLGMSEDDSAGFSVAAADFNGDGEKEVIIGALQEDGPGGDRPDAGALYIILQDAP